MGRHEKDGRSESRETALLEQALLEEIEAEIRADEAAWDDEARQRIREEARQMRPRIDERMRQALRRQEAECARRRRLSHVLRGAAVAAAVLVLAFSGACMASPELLGQLNALMDRSWGVRLATPFAVTEAGVWKREDAQLTFTRFESGEGEERTQTFAVPDGLIDIAAEGSALYGLLNDGGGQRVVRYDAQMKPQWEFDVSDRGLGMMIDVSDGVVYLLAEVQAGSELTRQIFYFDGQQPGEVRQQNLDDWSYHRAVQDFDVSDGLLCATDGAELALFDVGGGLKGTPVLESAQYVEIVGSVDGDVYVYAMSSSLMRINMMSGDVSSVDAGDMGAYVGLECVDGQLYTAIVWGDGWSTLPCALPLDNSYENKLVIVNNLTNAEGDPRYAEALRRFHERYPDMEVVDRWVDDDRVLAAARMSGEAGSDIIVSQEQMSPFNYLSGALVDLSSFPEFEALREDYLDFFDLFSVDGHLYGVPMDISMDLWEVNPELLARVGIDLPEKGWTWDDLFAMADRVLAYNETAETPVKLVADMMRPPYFVDQYVLNHVDLAQGRADFSDGKLETLLAGWKQLRDAGLVDETVDYEWHAMPENTLFCVHDYTSFYSISDMQLVYPPVIDESTRYVHPVTSMEISANSRHIEEAAYLLYCWMQPEVVVMSYLENAMPLLKDISLYEHSNYEPVHTSDENAEIWRGMLVNGLPEVFLGDLSRDQLFTLWPQFIDGEITAEQFVQLSQRRADMVLGE